MNVGNAAKRGSPLGASPERCTLKLTTGDTAGTAKVRVDGADLGALEWSANSLSRMSVVKFSLFPRRARRVRRGSIESCSLAECTADHTLRRS
jgi:hypothetical protein